MARNTFRRPILGHFPYEARSPGGGLTTCNDASVCFSAGLTQYLTDLDDILAVLERVLRVRYDKNSEPAYSPLQRTINFGQITVFST
jgi:hypothetical protein